MSVFSGIQQSVAKRLKEAAFLAPLDIVTEDKGNIEQMIANTLKRLGISVCVLMAEGDCDSPNLPGPYFDRVRCIVEVAENVLMNRSPSGTNRPASEVVEHVLKALHLFQTQDGLLFSVDREAFRIAANPPGATLTYHVRIITQFGLDERGA